MCCNAYIKQAVSFTSKANTTQYLHKAKVLGGQKKKKKKSRFITLQESSALSLPPTIPQNACDPNL